MLDMNVNLFPVSIEGHVSPSRLRRVYLFLWSMTHRHDLVRYSISAMVRIRVDDKYLLVKNRHWGKYQPVGGVFKRLPHSEHVLSTLGVCEDNMFKPDDLNRGDLRVQVPARSIPGFLNWYVTGNGRELHPWREFFEELVRPGILPAVVFPYTQFQHIRRHNTGIERARHTSNGARYECRIAEIFDLVPLKEQHTALLQLVHTHDDRVKWATAEEIGTFGVIAKTQPEATIAETTAWIV
jgi:hypothetical protein